MLGYPNQPVRTAFNNVTLSADYADNRYSFDCGGMSKLTLDFNYAMGAAESANKLLFTLEHSPDNGVNWYSLIIDNTSAVSTLTPRVWEVEGTNKVDVIIDIAYRKMRLSVAESGVVTNAGTVSVDYTLSGI
jgi:hypothetical protein